MARNELLKPLQNRSPGSRNRNTTAVMNSVYAAACRSGLPRTINQCGIANRRFPSHTVCLALCTAWVRGGGIG